jgi:phosphoribosylanthranilate isomerase
MSAGSAAGHRTVVKICGLTNLEDAVLALSAGADWLGFIVHGESPRAIDPSRAADIVASLGRGTAVAVMVGVAPEQALELARRMGAHRLQLHRADPAAWPAGFPLPCAFAVGMDAQGTPRSALPAPPHIVLLDTAHETMAGGTGRSFPWEAARELAAERAVMLAGGLDGGNVARAIAAARPFGVDASSRLERAPGLKDHDLVRRFVAAVRECDAAGAGRPGGAGDASSVGAA